MSESGEKKITDLSGGMTVLRKELLFQLYVSVCVPVICLLEHRCRSDKGDFRKTVKTLMSKSCIFRILVGKYRLFGR